MTSSGIHGLRPDSTLVDYDSSLQQGSFDVIVHDAIVGQINPNRDDNKDIDSTNDVDEYFLLLFGMIIKNMMSN